MFALPPGPGDEAYGELLRRAHDIGATEMAVFSVGRRLLGGIDLKLVAHVRPDGAALTGSGRSSLLTSRSSNRRRLRMPAASINMRQLEGVPCMTVARDSLSNAISA